MKTKNHSTFQIFRQLFHLSWPIILAFLMQVGYNIVDIFWVGKLGATAVAAVSLTGNIFFLILAVGQILGSGTVTLVAQSFGAGKIQRANSFIKQSLLLASIIALFACTTGFLFSKEIVGLLGGRDEILILGTQYLQIIFIGFFFQLLSFSINYGFRGAGDMITPMLIMFAATVVNIVLDPLLILGIGIFPRLGVQGAAIATAIAKMVSFVFGFIILLKGRSRLQLKLFQSWTIELRVIKTILKVGTPVGISYALMGLSSMAVFRIVALLSQFALAALGIAIRILQLASLPVVSIGIATTTLVGQSFGKKDLQKAIKTGSVAMLCATFIMICFGAFFISNAQFLISIFIDNPKVIAYGIEVLTIVSLYLVFIGLTTTMTGVLRGAGYTLPPMFAGLIKLGLLIVLAQIFSTILDMHVTGVWWAMFIAYGVETLVIFLSYLSGGWKKRGLALLDDIKVPSNPS